MTETEKKRGRLSRFLHKDKGKPASSSSSAASTSEVAPSRTPSGLRRASSEVVLGAQSRQSPDSASSSAPHHHHHHLFGHHHNNTPPPREMKQLSKSETLAKMEQIRERNAKLASIRQKNPPSMSNHSPAHDKIVYNPMGLSSTHSIGNRSSFYQSGAPDEERVLSHPVADPNDHLPDEYKQPHSNLFDEWEIDMSRIKLGDGGSSDVRIINAIGHKKRYYALKKFTLLKKETDEEFYKRAKKEYIIAKQASESRHCIDTIALVRIHQMHSLTRGWGMVLEYCSGGDLFNLITRRAYKYQPLQEKYCLFKQIAYGVKWLHENDIIHRDLKPENVLLDANGVCKLCDFGVSTYGHHPPRAFDTPVVLSTSYVGSPPYTPPEVMLLADKKDHEAKQFAYDPFAMDMWGLGMLLFCIIYGGVPFESAVNSNSQYRDYKLSFDRFAQSHPNFKFNKGYPKGPGVEFRWASHFQSQGASRVAWKLCDPTTQYRYTMDHLFNDPWMQSLEMCLYEDPDQLVSPFVLPGTGNDVPISSSASAASSRNPSRRATTNNGRVTSHGSVASHQEPVRSMLDPAPAPPASAANVNSGTDAEQSPAAPAAPMSPSSSSSSIHSQSSLTYGDAHPPVAPIAEAPSSMLHGLSTITSGDTEDEYPAPMPQSPSPPPQTLDPVREDGRDDNAGSDHPTTVPTPVPTPAPTVASMVAAGTHGDACVHPDFAQSKRIPSMTSISSSSPRVMPSRGSQINIPRNKSEVELLLIDSSSRTYKPNEHAALDTSGMCDLGYKIKKHNHLLK
ncbi:hypothetical protein DIURU_004474 [Diutina rugosa]|uniref:Protein kinase domain-containing protein n=1 Tax=Diutina rugosa TaxID=5481 RepID=A0A642UHH3_DIURU|nr:uncharacterized protein DIURU_004474 [Diutina rugosa]KAA8899093.1 hypothetical protein DIURU_004474 [Diutina rugosa]